MTIEIRRSWLIHAAIVLFVALAVLGVALFLSARESEANGIPECPPGYINICKMVAVKVDRPSAQQDLDDGDLTFEEACCRLPDVPPGICDGGKTARRWNMVSNMWERNLCDDLWVVTGDPFDMVFGRKSSAYGWDYGRAIQYLLDQGYSQAQLTTVEGQIDALVSEGLWDRDCNCVPDDADLSFLINRPPDAGYMPWLPMQ